MCDENPVKALKSQAGQHNLALSAFATVNQKPVLIVHYNLC
jgi:hypothetical protein